MEELPIVLNAGTVRLRHRSADTLANVIYVPTSSSRRLLVLDLLEQIIDTHASADASHLPIADVGFGAIGDEKVRRHDSFASPVGAVFED
ncbi:MAG: hypothetical protein ACK55Z_09635 [bacterium]